MTPSRRRRQLSGTIDVRLAPDEAWSLFTARGECRWVAGWSPVFAEHEADDTIPGTVFETRNAHGATTWVVTAARPGALISYARLRPPDEAGTVSVEIGANDRGSTVRVTYDLTALSEPAVAALDAFAGEFDTFLAGWERAIATALP